ncbi:DUF4381 domain-containing protein [uncultured Tolumonas sp.]|uniref:DUF4381 domain-containing protein n=1 Tax=uncultured Tolumonas sp. TaxID=263765 RepID=UPI002A0A12BC|nr:DUF4381 domain-containing protein [uncultured Tolumonas sp.]
MTAPLEQLHDILPGPKLDVLDNQTIVLISATLCAILFLILFYKSWPRYKFYWRLKRELRVIIKKNPNNCVPAINLLLKKVACYFWPREQFAGLHTTEWLKFLDKNSSCQFSRFSEEWENWSYSNSSLSNQEKKAIIRECKRWFRHVRNRRPL